MHEALELCGKHQEDDEQCQAEGERQAAAGLLVFQRLALVVDPRLVRERLPHDPFQKLQRFTQDSARGQAGRDGDGTQPVVAVERAGGGPFVDMNEVGQRDQFARGIRSHVDVRKIVCGRALVVTGLEDDVVLLAVLDVGRNPLFAHHGRERPADGLNRDAERSRAILVDSHDSLGLGLLQVAVDALKTRKLARPLEDEVPPFGEGLVIGTTEHELNGPAPTHAGQT